MADLARRASKERSKGRQKAMDAAAAAGVIQQQLADERSRMNNYKRALEAFYLAGGMGAADAKAYMEAREKIDDFNAAAAKVVMCAMDDQACKADKDVCGVAFEYLNNIGENPGTQYGNKSPEPAPVTPAPAAPEEAETVRPTTTPTTGTN